MANRHPFHFFCVQKLFFDSADWAASDDFISGAVFHLSDGFALAFIIEGEGVWCHVDTESATDAGVGVDLKFFHVGMSPLLVWTYCKLTMPKVNI